MVMSVGAVLHAAGNTGVDGGLGRGHVGGMDPRPDHPGPAPHVAPAPQRPVDAPVAPDVAPAHPDPVDASTGRWGALAGLSLAEAVAKAWAESTDPGVSLAEAVAAAEAETTRIIPHSIVSLAADRVTHYRWVDRDGVTWGAWRAR